MRAQERERDMKREQERERERKGGRELNFLSTGTKSSGLFADKSFTRRIPEGSETMQSGAVKTTVCKAPVPYP